MTTYKEKANDWSVFIEKFKEAVNTKDKAEIISLTSSDFFSGGSGLKISEWLDDVLFADSDSFIEYKRLLNSRIKEYKDETGKPYRATGNSSTGDLYFTFTNGKWMFGGIVGD